MDEHVHVSLMIERGFAADLASSCRAAAGVPDTVVDGRQWWFGAVFPTRPMAEEWLRTFSPDWQARVRAVAWAGGHG